jgi:archaellum component FlaC
MPIEKNTDQFYVQLSESVKLVFDLTSRIDERVKILMEKQNELDRNFQRIMDGLSSLSTRVSIVESKSNEDLKEQVEELEKRVHDLEMKNEVLNVFKSGTENRWNHIIDAAWKVIVGIAVAYIVFKTGIKP